MKFKKITLLLMMVSLSILGCVDGGFDATSESRSASDESNTQVEISSVSGTDIQEGDTLVIVAAISGNRSQIDSFDWQFYQQDSWQSLGINSEQLTLSNLSLSDSGSYRFVIRRSKNGRLREQFSDSLEINVMAQEGSPQVVDCGEIPHMTTETRTRYLASTVPLGSSCESQTQIRMCNDGQLSEFFPNNYQFDSCTVATAPPPTETEPENCGALAHGESEVRTRYQSMNVPFGNECQSQIQTRTCDDGVLSQYIPQTFQFESCRVDVASPSEPTGNIHSFTGLPLDSNGFTDLRAMVNTEGMYDDSRIVYVSSSDGNDSTGQIYNKYSPELGGNPFDPAGNVQAYSSIEAAKRQIRQGAADILLLKRGDVWTQSLGVWCAGGGLSNRERSIVAAYGSSGPRPLIRSTASTNLFFIIGCPDVATRFMIFADLDSYPSHKDPSSSDYSPVDEYSGSEAFAVLEEIEDVLFENIKTRFGQVNIQGWEGLQSRIAFRRNVVADNYNAYGFAQGLYVHGVDGLLVEENVFDSNGFNNNVPGAEASIFDHNVYIQHTNRNVIARRNITSNGAATGIQLRPGGVLSNNLFLNEAVPGFISGAGGEMSYNVVIGGKDPSYGPRSWGLTDSSSGEVRVFRNMVVHKRPGMADSNAFFIDLYDTSDSDNTDPALFMGPKRINFYENVVYNWRGSGVVSGMNSNEVESFTGGNNHLVTPGFSTSEFYGGYQLPNATLDNDSSGASFPDPDRTIETYMQSFGEPASTEAFMLRARSLSKWTWDSRWTAGSANNYLRQGFGLQNP